MKGRTLISLVSLVVVSTASLQAGVVPGRWKKVDGLQVGTRIVVTLKAGDRMECTFNSSDPNDLTLIDAERGEVKVPRSEVLKIVCSDKHNDSIFDGAAVGAGLGAFSGLFLGACFYSASASDTDFKGTMSWFPPPFRINSRGKPPRQGLGKE